jgi:hypothetical protein
MAFSGFSQNPLNSAEIDRHLSSGEGRRWEVEHGIKHLKLTTF